jgi:hypothetical protein
MYSSTSTTSLVETQRKVAGANDPLGTQHVAPPAPASRTSLVIGFLFCIILYAFNGTESINIDYQTYYQYTSSFEMVPSFYKVDLSSLPSLSAAVKAIQDTYGYSAPTTTNTKTSSSSSAAGNHYSSQNKNQDNIRYYNLALSTEENYKYSEMVFAGQYISIRSSLDYTYHQNYLPQRQLLQDTIISNILKKHNPSITDPDGNSCISPKNPWIVFTAGAMGSGKSYTIRHLAASDRFPLESFVTVDPDEIRRLLPEFELYLDHNPEEAGESTRKEAGFIAEMLTQIALKAGRNILVDGSLKDADWYQNHFNILRQDYNDVGLRIGILHITAPREAVFERSRVSISHIDDHEPILVCVIISSF